MREITLFDFTDDVEKVSHLALSEKQRKALNKSFTKAYEVLELYADKTKTVGSIEELRELLERAKDSGKLAIDTETTGLDPIQNHIVGLSFSFPFSDYGYYVPLYHLDFDGNHLEENLPIKEVSKVFLEVDFTDTEVIMFNSVFDMRVIRHWLKVELVAGFDSYVAMRLMNENEESNSLKDLYDKYVARDGVKKQHFNKLFDPKMFRYTPIDLATMYAGFDPIMTYGLYEFQKGYLDTDKAKKYDLQKISNIFYNIEMPIQKIVTDIEDRGLALDLDFNAYLLEKKQAELDKLIANFDKSLEEFEPQIRAYQDSYNKRKAMGEDVTYQWLDYPVLHSSPYQLKILYYTIIGEESHDKKLSTDEEHLKRFKHKSAKILLEIRTFSKLISTYVGKFPEIISPVDGKIRSKFNSVGADTLRFTSRDINFQNIPSQDRDIRKVFIADKGKKFISADYSGQEVRITAEMANDDKMIQAYLEGRDVYSEGASLIFGVPYEECIQTRDGEYYASGAERRNVAKAIVLGIIYGKQPYSIAKELNQPSAWGYEVYDKLLNSFGNLRSFIDESLDMARNKGYVTTYVGTKRRLPDIQKEPFEIYGYGVSDTIKSSFIRRLEACRSYMDKKKIIDKANRDGIKIIDNTTKINQAERQAVNARVQGTAGFMLKVAMILMEDDEELAMYGFEIVNIVHDEILAQVDEEFAEVAGERMKQLMEESARVIGFHKVPFVSDVEIMDRWYEHEVGDGDYWLEYIKEQEKGKK